MIESDHDLLIRIDAHLNSIVKWQEEHSVLDEKRFSNIDSKLVSAHKRMDILFKVFNMVTGAWTFIGIIGTVVGVIVGIHKVGWW